MDRQYLAFAIISEGSRTILITNIRSRDLLTT